MAAIWLDEHEWRDGEVPNVCMRCGDDATDCKKHSFGWVPSWVYITILVGLPVLLIVALISRQRRRIWVPLCERHRDHWRWRTLITWGTLGALLVGIALLAVAAAVATNDELKGETVLGF